MIGIDAVWLCTQPQDMRTGADRLLAVVVNTVGQAQAHHGWLFSNARATRIKLLVHDGQRLQVAPGQCQRAALGPHFGVWCATRGLHSGSFAWTSTPAGTPALQLTAQQFEALVVGLPWQRLPELQVICRACSAGAPLGACVAAAGNGACANGARRLASAPVATCSGLKNSPPSTRRNWPATWWRCCSACACRSNPRIAICTPRTSSSNASAARSPGAMHGWTS